MTQCVFKSPKVLCKKISRVFILRKNVLELQLVNAVKFLEILGPLWVIWDQLAHRHSLERYVRSFPQQPSSKEG